MGEVPGFLLVHTATVEPYLDWDTYGPPTTIRCFVGENLASAGPQGTERVGQITIICRLAEDVPQGSRITLTDGRRGYAAAVVRNDGGGLPTPDHLQIAMSIAAAYGPAFGETIGLLHRTVFRDDAGGVLYDWDRTDLTAAVRFLTSAEAAVGAAETTVDTVEVILPPDTIVGTRDRLDVRGLIYDVDGTPTDISDPQSTARPGVRVIGKRRAA